jgi:hypothetical protein
VLSWNGEENFETGMLKWRGIFTRESTERGSGGRTGLETRRTAGEWTLTEGKERKRRLNFVDAIVEMAGLFGGSA